eukprot:766008-Hanusia_phi.AAC.5
MGSVRSAMAIPSVADPQGLEVVGRDRAHVHLQLLPRPLHLTGQRRKKRQERRPVVSAWTCLRRLPRSARDIRKFLRLDDQNGTDRLSQLLDDLKELPHTSQQEVSWRGPSTLG